MSIELVPVDPDRWELWRQVRLRALADAPEAFGSKLADWQGAGDTEQRWRQRLTVVALNLVARVDERPVGQVSGTESDLAGQTELLSMWVAPEARGQGVGDALISAIVDWSERRAASSIMLHVRPGNVAAVALYHRHGFTDTGHIDDGEHRMVRQLPRLPLSGLPR